MMQRVKFHDHALTLHYHAIADIVKGAKYHDQTIIHSWKLDFGILGKAPMAIFRAILGFQPTTISRENIPWLNTLS